MHVGFIDLEKAYDKVNREALRVPNARVRKLCRVKKGLDGRIHESMLVVQPCGEG